MVDLERALVLFREGRTGEVKELAQEMVATFGKLGIRRETVNAIELFAAAARKEALTRHYLLRLERFLEASKADPDLRFEAFAG